MSLKWFRNPILFGIAFVTVKADSEAQTKHILKTCLVPTFANLQLTGDDCVCIHLSLSLYIVAVYLKQCRFPQDKRPSLRD